MCAKFVIYTKSFLNVECIANVFYKLHVNIIID